MTHVSDKYSGTIGVDDVIGKAAIIVWPVSRFGLLGSPDIQGTARPPGDGRRAASAFGLAGGAVPSWRCAAGAGAGPSLTAPFRELLRVTRLPPIDSVSTDAVRAEKLSEKCSSNRFTLPMETLQVHRSRNGVSCVCTYGEHRPRGHPRAPPR